jgi:hypothetical protein
MRAGVSIAPYKIRQPWLLSYPVLEKERIAKQIAKKVEKSLLKC